MPWCQLRAGVRSEAALSRWETGKSTPTAFDLRRIAMALELPTEAADILVFPPAVYDPVMDRLFERVEEFANRSRSSVMQQLHPTAEDLAAEAAALRGVSRLVIA